MSIKEKKKLIDLIEETKQSHDLGQIRKLLNKVEVHLIEEVNRNKRLSEDAFTIKETAEHFHVTPQAVHKWIHQSKVDYIENRTPGGGVHYKIPKNQFDGHHFIEKRFNRKRKLKETQKKVNWHVDTSEDFYPVSNEEDRMEELDFD